MKPKEPQRGDFKTEKDYLAALTKYINQGLMDQVEIEYQKLLEQSPLNNIYAIPEDSPCNRCPSKLECPYQGQEYRKKKNYCLIFSMLEKGKIDPVETSITEITKQEVRTFIKQHKN